MKDLYIPMIDLPILLQENMWTDPGNIEIAHRHTNLEIGTEAGQCPEKEYINGIFVAVHSDVGWKIQRYASEIRTCALCNLANVKQYLSTVE